MKNFNLYLLLSLIITPTLSAQQWTNWTWERLTMPGVYNSSYYLDVMFLPSNPRIGWACGSEGGLQNRTGDGVIVRTTDGGTTWRGVTIPNAPQLESINFVNPLVGFCSGTNGGNGNAGGIYRSRDGGVTWEEITPVVRINGVTQRAQVWGNYFLNERVGMVVGGGCGGELQTFFRTEDGGDTWSLFTANVASSGLSHVKMYSENGLCYASGSGRIWRSVDGGRTWEVYKSTGAQYWQENLNNIGNSFLLATSGTDCYGQGDNRGDARFSTDGGNTWKYYVTRGSMFGAFMLNPTTGWVSGWNGEIWRTSDAGNTWKKYNCGLPEENDWDDLWFVNDTLGYVCGNGIYRTKKDFDPPTITANKLNVCEGDTITLTVTKDYKSYLWSNGQTTKTIRVDKSGEYFVMVSEDGRCTKSSNSLNIKVFPPPKLELTSSSGIFHFCYQDSITVNAPPGYQTYKWSDGTTGNSIIVKTEGTYTLDVIDTNGCTGTVQVDVTGGKKIVPQITGSAPLRFCEGDTVVLYATAGFAKYEWNDGTNGNYHIVKTPGKFVVKVTDKYGCTGISDTAEVIVDPNYLEMFTLPEFTTLVMDSAKAGVMICDSIIVGNSGPIPLLVSKSSFNRNVEFSVPQAKFPVTLQPGERLAIAICYLASALETQRDTMIIGGYCKRRIYVQSAGKPEYYKSSEMCNLLLEGVTISLTTPGLYVTPPSPNPADNTIAFVVAFPTGSQSEITLTDVLGNIRNDAVITTLRTAIGQNKLLEGKQILVDAHSLPEGMYYMQIRTETEQKVMPVLIKR